MPRTFTSRDDAESYMAAVSPGSVRMMSSCDACGVPCAVSVGASWVLSPDLFGSWNVVRVAAVRPSPDPCGHGTRVWRRVVTSPNPGRACGDGCKSASSAECSCSCDGGNHGLFHRPRP